jgi:excisionase family DNA binding protein
LLAELVKKAELSKAGIKDPFEQHRHCPLAEHLAEWEAGLGTRPRGKRRRPPTAKQVALKVGRARRVIEGCSFRVAGDITLAAVQDCLQALAADRPAAAREPGKEQFTRGEVARVLGIKNASVAPLVARHRLAAQGKGKARRFPRATVEALLAYRARGMDHGTAGYYAREIKSFTRWLARRRIAEDMLADLPGASPDQSDHRHDRRTPSEDELRGVIGAAQASPRGFRGLEGRDRAILYATAAASGFRVEELASLTPEAFNLVSDVASVTLRGDVAKNGQTAVQPLPPDLAQALRSYLAGRPAGQPVWPGTWNEKAAYKEVIPGAVS